MSCEITHSQSVDVSFDDHRLDPLLITKNTETFSPDSMMFHARLVVGFPGTWLDYFPRLIWNVIIPIDSNLFQRGRLNHQPEDVGFISVKSQSPKAWKVTSDQNQGLLTPSAFLWELRKPTVPSTSPSDQLENSNNSRNAVESLSPIRSWFNATKSCEIPMKISWNPYEILITRYSGWWFGTCFTFPYIGNVIIPIDFHIFRRGSNHQPDKILNPHEIGSQTMCFG